MISVVKKDENESNESLMRRFSRKTILVVRENKGRDTFSKKPTREKRRHKAQLRTQRRAQYAQDIRTGKIKEEARFKRNSKKN